MAEAVAANLGGILTLEQIGAELERQLAERPERAAPAPPAPPADRPTWFDALVAQLRKDPTAHAATLALALDPNGTGKPTGRDVTQWLEHARQEAQRFSRDDEPATPWRHDPPRRGRSRTRLHRSPVHQPARNGAWPASYGFRDA